MFTISARFISIVVVIKHNENNYKWYTFYSSIVSPSDVIIICYYDMRQ